MDEQRQQKLIYIMTHASENGFDTTKFNRFLSEQYSKWDINSDLTTIALFC